MVQCVVGVDVNERVEFGIEVFDAFEIGADEFDRRYSARAYLFGEVDRGKKYFVG